MRINFLIILILSVQVVSAQEVVRTQHSSVSKKTYSFNQTVLMVEGFKTTERALGLFKPDQIIMRDERPLHERGDTLVLTIHVKDRSHPVLHYFKKEAKILYKDKLYPHGIIPEINYARVSEVVFQSMNGAQDDYLEVKLYGEEYIPSNQGVFKTEIEARTTHYFDLDGMLYTADEFRKIVFKPGELISKGTLTGKEAVDKYGDKKYAGGVGQFTRKK